jgi:hypothetical protein
MPFMERFEYEERLATQRAFERYVAKHDRVEDKKRLHREKEEAERRSAIGKKIIQLRRKSRNL